jgi:hypothetical protein
MARLPIAPPTPSEGTQAKQNLSLSRSKEGGGAGRDGKLSYKNLSTFCRKSSLSGPENIKLLRL